jgi:hypothetical protein
MSTRAAQLLAAVAERLDHLLIDHCFKRIDESIWLRRWGWKSDQIRVTLKGDRGIIITLDVLIPPSPDINQKYQTDFDSETIGCVNLHTLLDGYPRLHRFPRLSWFDAAFVREVTESLPLAVAWFSRYDTPELCLRELATPHANRQSDSFRYSESYLESLPIEYANTCCAVNQQHEYCNLICRSVFDIRYKERLPNIE